MSFVPAQTLLTSAFGELISAEYTPVFQLYASHGVRDNMFVLTDGSGASVTEVDSNFVIESGTSSGGTAALTSIQDAKYRSGQGLAARFTALFESNAVDSIQGAGFINDSQGFVFGYENTEFGVARFHGGKVECQQLLVTTAAGGAENATVTVDGTAYTVPLTAGSVQHNAWEIANSLQSQVPNYFFTSNDATVSSVDTLARVNGAFAFTSATCVAAWTQRVAGLEPTQDWVSQANWSNPPSWDFDPAKGNVYKIQVQYLGYGGIFFYMENPNTSKLELVHVYSYSNTHVLPSVEDPSFRVGWFIQNTGNTSNLIVRGASAGAFVEGRVQLDERSRSANVNTVVLTTAITNLITIRNRIDYEDKANRITSYPLTAIVSGEHNKPILFHFHLNGTFSGDLDYGYADVNNSVMEVATDHVGFNMDGRELGTVQTRSTAPFTLDISRALQYLLPGETLTIAAQLSSGTGGEADAAIYWLEDQ